MRCMSFLFAIVAAVVISSGARAMPTTYSGVTFPDGDISFADEVISFSPGPDVAALSSPQVLCHS
jgi:hypothetical protein